MSSPFIPPAVKATLSALLAVPEYTHVLLLASAQAGRPRAEVDHDLEGIIRTKVESAAWEALTPRALVALGLDQSQSWRAAVEAAFKQGGVTPPTSIQKLCLRVAQEAETKRSEIEQAIHDVRDRLAAIHREWEGQKSEHGSPRELRQVRRLFWVLVALLFGVEASALSLAFGQYFGMFDETPPRGALVTTLSASGTLNSALFGASLLIGTFLPKAGVPASARWFGLAAGVAMLVLIAASGAVLRFIGGIDPNVISSEMQATGDAVYTTIVGIGTLTIGGAVAWIKAHTDDLGERLTRAKDCEDHYSAKVGRETDTLNGHLSDLAKCEAERLLPDVVDANFELAVQQCGSVQSRVDQETRHLLTRCIAAYDQLLLLSADDRATVAARLHRIEERDGTEGPSLLSRLANWWRPGGAGAAGAALALVVAAGSPSLVGCGEGNDRTESQPMDVPAPNVPQYLVIGCDNSGGPGTCDVEFIVRYFAGWSEVFRNMPGSTFQVLITADTFQEVEVLPAIRIPESYGRDRGARATWTRKRIAELRAIELPEAGPEVARSNLVDLALVGNGLVAPYAEDWETRLVLGSDGRHVGYGFNFEKRIPTAEEFTAALGEQGVPWNLAFTFTEFCGFSNAGLDARAFADRRDLWTGLIKAGGAIPRDFHASCTDWIEPLPAHLRDSGATR